LNVIDLLDNARSDANVIISKSSSEYDKGFVNLFGFRVGKEDITSHTPHTRAEREREAGLLKKRGEFVMDVIRGESA